MAYDPGISRRIQQELLKSWREGLRQGFVIAHALVEASGPEGDFQRLLDDLLVAADAAVLEVDEPKDAQTKKDR